MPLPALQNRTVRLLVLTVATICALAAMVGSATLSYRQTRAQTIQSLSQKAGLWEDATAFLINGSRTNLEAAASSTEGRATTKSVAVLRRLVADSPLYRSAVIVRDGLIVCSYVGVVDPPVPAPPELLEFSTPGDVRLVKIPGDDGQRDAIAINFDTGRGFSLSVTVPSPGIAELMRYGDRESTADVYLMDANGVVLDHSLGAVRRLGSHVRAAAPTVGLSETSGEILMTRQIPGRPYLITAVVPKEKMLALWSRSLPIYGGLALILAVFFFIAASMANAQTRSLDAELREAARLNQIVPHYQPILDLAAGRCIGVEVLMRWQHPSRGLVPPAAFIPEAERTGVITQLTECLMVRAFGELEAVFATRPQFHAAINIPVQTLMNPAFPAHVDRLIRRRFQYRQLHFEITESTSLNDSSLVQLRAMKDLGVRLAVDDFGTGYSNLRYLSIFPFDFLKIDKAFVDGISVEGKSSGLVDQIVSIGRACGLQLIAEGIEHQAQAAYMKTLGVEYGQGFHFARPMPLDELQAWLAARESGFAPEAAQVPPFADPTRPIAAQS